MKTTTLHSTLFATTEPTARSGLLGAVAGLFDGVRKAAADRALHRQLSEMDDALLRDIGLGDDEIYRLRQGAYPRHYA